MAQRQRKVKAAKPSPVPKRPRWPEDYIITKHPERPGQTSPPAAGTRASAVEADPEPRSET